MDMTLRWSCRKGDYVLWFTWTNLLAGPEHGVTIKDLWEMKDGDFVTMTNRAEDMSEWFSFHPTEVCDSLAYKMLDRFNKGDYPEEPIEAPNIWRPKTGDRLLWTGKTRSGIKGPVLSAVAFRESALVIGDNVRTQSMEQYTAFGSLTKPQQTQEEISMCREAVTLVRQMGVPREYAPHWKIG